MQDYDVDRIVAKYQKCYEKRMTRMMDFVSGKKDFLVWTHPDTKVWKGHRMPEDSFRENMLYIERALDAEMDFLPYLEPWHGVGIYAASFGCVNIWHDDGSSPSTQVAFQHISEALECKPLSPLENELMSLVLASIRYFKAKVGDAIPIALTDTQSANDTASLVVDSCNFMVECINFPDLAHSLLKSINNSIISFSRMQADLIGSSIATPGHIMACCPGLKGISVSDDNRCFASSAFNMEFTNPYLEELGKEFDGLAVHSCGNWTHTMSDLKSIKSCIMIDCAGTKMSDPSPNDPAKVAEVMSDSGMIVQVRCGGTKEDIDFVIDRAAKKGMRLVLKYGWPGSLKESDMLYEYTTERLSQTMQN